MLPASDVGKLGGSICRKGWQRHFNHQFRFGANEIDHIWPLPLDKLQPALRKRYLSKDGRSEIHKARQLLTADLDLNGSFLFLAFSRRRGNACLNVGWRYGVAYESAC